VQRRQIRIAIDVVFLLLSLYSLVQDWDDRSVAAAVGWGLFSLFWVAAIVYDLRRKDDHLF
jgi:hypothetical protein